jgi:DNA-directed RNA polymerase subunit RPC12/RpoP
MYVDQSQPHGCDSESGSSNCMTKLMNWCGTVSEQLATALGAMRCAYCTLRVADLFTVLMLLDQTSIRRKKGAEAKFSSDFVGRNKRSALRRIDVGRNHTATDSASGSSNCMTKLMNWCGTVSEQLATALGAMRCAYCTLRVVGLFTVRILVGKKACSNEQMWR